MNHVRAIRTQHRFWHIPVSEHGKNITLTCQSRGNSQTHSFLLAPVASAATCDFIASSLIPPDCQGQITFSTDTEEDILKDIFTSDNPVQTTDYMPSYRQLFHYSPPCGWQSDPNGLFYFEGTYHLFHQHDPFHTSTNWNTTWFHAVSKDLLHWVPKGVALLPNHAGKPFSGSAVVDVNNVSQLGKTPGQPPILLFHTRTASGNFQQHLAYSIDGGLTFQDYPHNPILPTVGDGDDRDPSIAFDPQRQEWLLALFLGEQHQEFSIFTSTDLLHWREIQRFTIPDGLECPDLFPLKDNQTGQLTWILLTATGRYVCGFRQGTHFAWQPPQNLFHLQGSLGAYAGKTYDAQGRRIFIAWNRNRNGAPNTIQSLTLPTELQLANGRLLAFPCREITALNAETITTPQDFHVRIPNPLPTNHIPWKLDLTTDGNTETELFIGGTPVLFSATHHFITVNGTIIPYPDNETAFDGSIFIDRNSLEFFDRQGRMAAFITIDHHGAPPIACNNWWHKTHLPRCVLTRLKSLFPITSEP